VRVTHLPTGISAESRSERSQHRNFATALAMLRGKIYRLQEDKTRAPEERIYDEKGELDWSRYR
jgi:peptide chain release factor 2